MVDSGARSRDTGPVQSAEVTFPGRPGRRLAGTWHTPSAGPVRGAVVVAHGMLSSRASPKHRELCDRAASHGLAALRFDFAGRGESVGVPGDLTVTGEIADLLAAVAWVRDRVGAPFAVVGSSLGGTVAILAATRARPEALVTVAAPAELPVQPRPAWTSTSTAHADDVADDEPEAVVPATFFADARLHDPVAAARSVRCPWLVIHGALDEVVPVDHARSFVGACASTTLCIHPHAGHRFWSPSHRRWLVDRAIEFVSDALRRPPSGA